jgi:hypothetical protein
VRVDERRCEYQPLAVDHTVRIGLEPRPELGDRPVVDADVQDGVDRSNGIEDAGAADDQVVLLRVPGLQHHATSCRSATLTPTGPVVSRS